MMKREGGAGDSDSTVKIMAQSGISGAKQVGLPTPLTVSFGQRHFFASRLTKARSTRGCTTTQFYCLERN